MPQTPAKPAPVPQHAPGPQSAPGKLDGTSARHSSGIGWSRTPRIVAGVAIALIALGGTSVAAVVADLRSQVEVSDVSGLVVGAAASAPKPKDPDDPFKDMPVNILVMGTDYRDAATIAIAGKDEGGGLRSDTTFLVHISADRTWIEVVSIPRDSMVSIPACKLPGGGTARARDLNMFNGAFGAVGNITGKGPEDLTYAAACTLSTVVENTGLPLPNHLVVKMDGVIGIVDALGGVQVCLPEPIEEDKRYGSLVLPAGPQTLNGYQSIQYVRARHGEGLGNGGDLDRIERQQGFINAALRQALAGETLANPAKMLPLAQAVLGSLSPDAALADAANLTGLAFSLRGIDKSRIVFRTVPNVPWPQDHNRVIWTDEADELWARLAADQPPADLTPLPPPAAVTPSPGTTDVVAPPATAPGGTDAGATDPAATDPAAGTPVAPAAPAVEPSLPPGTCV
ncbi:LCP family protein [Antribacter sp. KLBMP9083]|uniref:LCP family protein n=1 Tax=Antribacter soli TaxID=2910976 RepID=A0AA41QAE1_9MICO|nr:LCP family protein [Antribacter soli]MCF4119823.1 LCP family protein [Antribacter soli]